MEKEKQNFTVDDYGFETTYGQDIEVTTEYPKIRIFNNTFEKLFKNKLKRTYLRVTVFVVP